MNLNERDDTRRYHHEELEDPNAKPTETEYLTLEPMQKASAPETELLPLEPMQEKSSAPETELLPIEPIQEKSSAPDTELLPLEPIQEKSSSPETHPPHNAAGEEIISSEMEHLTEMIPQYKKWGLLGFADANLSTLYIDTFKVKSHKFWVNPEVYRLRGNRQFEKFHLRLTTSYETSFEFVEYKTIEPFTKSSSRTEFGVFATVKLKSKFVIPGVDGYTAPIGDSEMTEEMEFSVVTSASNRKLMLGPTSFVNHSCRPNAQYFLGEGTKVEPVLKVETIQEINVGEELLSYGPHYFDTNNKKISLQTLYE